MPEEDRWQRLADVIQQWNSNRLDLFEISQPSKTLDFSGVMRFCLEDPVGGSFATKCLRIGSSSTTRDVIETLLEKFRPDMKMLTTPYCLYEVHANVERKLDIGEKPLVVQLNWNTDNREGRFVLKTEQDLLLEANCHEKKEKGGMIHNFKRTLSRKERKERKGEEDLKTMAPGKEQLTDKSLSKMSLISKPEPRSSEERKVNQSQLNPGGVYSQSLRRNTTTSTHNDQPENMEDLQLPVGVKFRDNSEDAFLCAVINYTNSSTVHFKLSPAYVLYMAARFVLNRGPTRPPNSSSADQRQEVDSVRQEVNSVRQEVNSIINKMVGLMEGVIQKQRGIAGAVAFWMANASELLNFIRQDQELNQMVSQHIQGVLAQLVLQAFKWLSHCLQVDLRKHMTAFLIDPDEQLHAPEIEGVVNTLTGAMSLLRRSRVNPALTIQLFSKLFHFIGAWLFNRLVQGPEVGPPLGLLSHYWGVALRRRLGLVQSWAERRGLELAADCHLSRIIQATELLTMNKYSIQDVNDIQATCFKLNSLQLRKMMSCYLYAPDEPHIPHGLIDSVVIQAEATEDDARDVRLEESMELHLPFLLPEGGYSYDTVRGIPHGFREFLQPICRKGLCTLISHPHSNGMWTVFFNGAKTCPRTACLSFGAEPEVVCVTLSKPLNSGMGVSIVAAKAAGHGNLGIYVKSIVRGGPAEMDGRLAPGDQLLSVDGQSLMGLPQERAAEVMLQTGPIVTLQVAKMGACYHGLDQLLHEAPSMATMDVYQSSANGKTHFLTGDTSQRGSGIWGKNSETHRRKMEHSMLRNRQLYRSDPNVADSEALAGTEGRISAGSTGDLCSEACPRDYQTLPMPRSKDKKPQPEDEKARQTSKVMIEDKRAYMRHAHSQDNLSLEIRGPLVDKQRNHHQDQGKEQMSCYYAVSTGPSYPISSVSPGTSNPLSYHSVPAGPNHSSLSSGPNTAAHSLSSGPNTAAHVLSSGPNPASRSLSTGPKTEAHSLSTGPNTAVNSLCTGPSNPHSSVSTGSNTPLSYQSSVPAGPSHASVPTGPIPTGPSHASIPTGPSHASISTGANIPAHSRASASTDKQQSKRTSGSGYWRTPLSLQNPVTSAQPIRIDIPVTRPPNTGNYVSLTTFRQNASSLIVKLHGQNSSNERALLGNQRHVIQPPTQYHQVGHFGSTNQLPQPAVTSLPSQQQPLSSHKDHVIRLQVAIPQISHQGAIAQSSHQLNIPQSGHQRAIPQSGHQGAIPQSGHQVNIPQLNQQVNIPQSSHQGAIAQSRQIYPQRLTAQLQPHTTSNAQTQPKHPDTRPGQSEGGSQSSDPGTKELRGEQDKLPRHQSVEQLEQKVRELRAKAELSPEEGERLSRLALEWQFQSRLREYTNNGEEDEEEEDEDAMTIMQQLEVENKLHVKKYSKQHEEELKKNNGEDQGPNHLGNRDIQDQREKPRIEQEEPSFAARKKGPEALPFRAEPETLPFRERQRLFSAGSCSTANIKAV